MRHSVATVPLAAAMPIAEVVLSPGEQVARARVAALETGFEAPIHGRTMGIVAVRFGPVTALVRRGQTKVVNAAVRREMARPALGEFAELLPGRPRVTGAIRLVRIVERRTTDANAQGKRLVASLARARPILGAQRPGDQRAGGRLPVSGGVEESAPGEARRRCDAVKSSLRDAQSASLETVRHIAHRFGATCQEVLGQ